MSDTPTVADLIGPEWTPDDTEQWLSKNALPTDFRWERAEKHNGEKVLVPGQIVMPEYTIKKGYGFWLRTTPYFPGLFEQIHAILLAVPDDEPLPTPEELAARLHLLKTTQLPAENLFL